MTDQEKVIAAIEACSFIAHPDCSKCYLDGPGFGFACRDQLMRDALALLKAQEPRVMTLEEVKSCWRNREIAFLVDYNDGGNMVWITNNGKASAIAGNAGGPNTARSNAGLHASG